MCDLASVVEYLNLAACGTSEMSSSLQSTRRRTGSADNLHCYRVCRVTLLSRGSISAVELSKKTLPYVRDSLSDVIAVLHVEGRVFRSVDSVLSLGVMQGVLASVDCKHARRLVIVQEGRIS